jgi:NAD(P)-dependent dehydrogenase (short-subunit alcohol dehydrogenase family)
MSTTTKKALVVGGTSGIGKGIAIALAKKGNIDVNVAGRSAERGEEVVQHLRKLSPNCSHKFTAVNGFDLSSFEVLKDERPNILIMSQGMATIQGYTPTKDGLDQKLQLHYFSRIHLTRLLDFPSNARILSVLSAGVHSRYEKFESDFDLSNGSSYSLANAANAAGFYNDAGLEQFASFRPNLTVVHAAPGFVNTSWGTEMPWYLRGLVRMIQPFGRDLETCGEVLTNALLGIKEPGFHRMDPDGKPVKSKVLYSKEERESIWKKTLDLLPKF